MSAAWITFRLALREAASNRLSLGIQMVVMIINDLVWVLFCLAVFVPVGIIHPAYDRSPIQKWRCLLFRLILLR